jgi:TolB protein
LISGRRLLHLIMTLGVLMASLPVAAELLINVSGGMEDARPIAVVPFERPEGQIDVAAIIASDLQRSGRFAPMERRDMIDQPTHAMDVDYQDWRLLDVETLIVGRQVANVNGRPALQFQVLDVYRGAQLIGYSVPVANSDWRTAAHQVADLIYEALTGERGAFTTRVAYVTETGSGDARQYSLIVADADGANAAAVLTSSMPIMSPAWSPNGRQMAYVSFENERAEIFVQELSTGSRGDRPVSATPGINGAPAFSPDGTHLAVALSHGGTNLDIYLLDLRSGALTRMTENSAADTEPQYSPDGSSIYFTSDRGGGPQVYRIPSGGGRAERVTFEGRYNARPRISADGRYLTMVHLFQGDYRIAVQDLRSGVVQVLTTGQQDESPSFAPNGAIIIYATQEGDQGVLASSSVDGRFKQTFRFSGGNVREPVWGPYSAAPQMRLPGSD